MCFKPFAIFCMMVMGSISSFGQTAFAAGSWEGRWLMVSDQGKRMSLALTETGDALTGTFHRDDEKKGTITGKKIEGVNAFSGANISLVVTGNANDRATCIVMMWRVENHVRGICKSNIDGNAKSWYGVKFDNKIAQGDMPNPDFKMGGPLPSSDPASEDHNSKPDSELGSESENESRDGYLPEDKDRPADAP